MVEKEMKDIKYKNLVLNKEELLAFFEENRELKGNIGIITTDNVNMYGDYLLKGEKLLDNLGLFMKGFVVGVIPIDQIKFVFVRNGSD